ncbi:MAG TPA: hypothetical protein VGX68_07790 [Thermoanaerobaculia bacterium]|nr:hypothetical protein [Thermoanaerobaculia bacterium]
MIASSAARFRLSPEALAFALLLALHLALIWAFPFIPTQDGPGHQALAFILRQYDGPDAGLLRQYYLPNREALPNWFIFFLMSRVLGFVSVPMAEKLLLTAYVVLLPLGVRYALRAIDPRAAFLSVLVFPFTYNYLFQMGFFNFCFSLAAFFFTLGYWLEASRRMSALRTAGLALLVLWVYFCHPVTLVMTVAALLTLAGWRLLLERLVAAERRFAWRELAAGARTWLLSPVLACLPALALMASFLGRRADARISMLPLWVKLKHLGGLYSLASVSRWTILLAAVLALLFYGTALACLIARARRPFRVGDGLLLVAIVFVVAYFAAPSELAGGGFINHRLNLFPFLALILWFGTFDHPAGRSRGIQIAAFAVAIAFLGVFGRTYAQVDEGLAKIAAASEHVEPDHTLLFLSYAHQGERPGGQPLVFRTEPFVHASGYIGARKRLVDLSLYEASEDYFPIYFNPRLDPYRHLAAVHLGIETAPPRVDLLGYPKRTGGRIDYVLLWGLREDRRREPAVRDVLEQLAAGYKEVWDSADRAVRLYKRGGR